MTKEDKLEVLDLMEVYYMNRTDLNKKQEKEIIDFVDELKKAIEDIRCSTELCECKFPNIRTGANNNLEYCGFCGKDLK